MNEPLFLTKEEVLAYHAQILSAPEELYEAMLRLTTSDWDKERFAGFLRSHSRSAEQ